MKRTIRLRESELRRMIAESVKRVLREQKEEYDWDFPEEDLEGIKSIENDASWDAKNAGDAYAKASTQIWDIQGSPDGWIEDFPQYQTDDSVNYDNGYEKMYGDRDVNDEYFTDSDYYFKNDKWQDIWHPQDIKAAIDNRYDKNSNFNRRLKTHESFNRKINRIVSECLKRNFR